MHRPIRYLSNQNSPTFLPKISDSTLWYSRQLIFNLLQAIHFQHENRITLTTNGKNDYVTMSTLYLPVTVFRFPVKLSIALASKVKNILHFLIWVLIFSRNSNKNSRLPSTRFLRWQRYNIDVSIEKQTKPVDIISVLLNRLPFLFFDVSLTHVYFGEGKMLIFVTFLYFILQTFMTRNLYDTGRSYCDLRIVVLTYLFLCKYSR